MSSQAFFATCVVNGKEQEGNWHNVFSPTLGRNCSALRKAIIEFRRPRLNEITDLWVVYVYDPNAPFAPRPTGLVIDR